MKKLIIAVLLLSGCLAMPVLADKPVKDASGTNFNTCTETASTTEVTCVRLRNTANATIDPATKQSVDAVTTAVGALLQAGVALPAGENHVGEFGGHTQIPASTFTTTSATTAWTAGQLIANSAANTSVTPLSFTVCRVNTGTGMVRRARIKFASDTGFVGASLILYLYKDTPATITNGDRGAWLTSESNYIGKVPVVLNNHFTDYEKGVGVPTDSNGNTGELNYACGSGLQTIYGLLVANSTITPVAGSKAVSVELETITN